MAARRTPEQKQAVAKLVQRLYAISGAETWSQFAELAHVHWASLSDWQTGKSVPDGWNLLLLLRAASDRSEGVELGEAVDQLGESLPTGRHEPLEATVAGLVAWQETVTRDVARLRRDVAQLGTRLAQLEDGAAPQRAQQHGR